MVDERVKELAQGANFATIATFTPSGNIQTNVMWVHSDDEHILMNTETGRDKYRNILKEPRVSVAVWDQSMPYRYAQVRGRVVDMVTGPEARAHIDELSMKYNGTPYSDEWITTERVILKIRPERQRAFG